MPKPTRPLLPKYKVLLGAVASIVKGTVPPSTSSIENLFAPPLSESFMVICQSLVAKVALLLVSSNFILKLFSFNRMVSNPKLSPLLQSTPTH